MASSNQDNSRKNGFYIIDNRIIDEYGARIGVFGIAVYNLIAKYANEKGQNAFPSYQTIADKLGISRPKAVTTINNLVELGLIKKAKRLDDAGDATSNIYTIIPLGGGKCGLPPSTQDLPQVVNDVNQGGKPHLPDQYPTNKTQVEQEKKQADAVATQPDLKPKKEKKAKKSNAEPTIPVGQNDDEEKTLTPQQEYFGALCWIVGWNSQTITEKQTGQIAQAMGVLQKANYSIEDLRLFWRQVWTSDWRWTKEKQRPTISQVRAEIGKVRTIHVNGFAQDVSINQSIAKVEELER